MLFSHNFCVNQLLPPSRRPTMKSANWPSWRAVCTTVGRGSLLQWIFPFSIPGIKKWKVWEWKEKKTRTVRNHEFYGKVWHQEKRKRSNNYYPLLVETTAQPPRPFRCIRLLCWVQNYLSGFAIRERVFVFCDLTLGNTFFGDRWVCARSTRGPILPISFSRP